MAPSIPIIIQALYDAMVFASTIEALDEGFAWLGEHRFPIAYHLFKGKRALVVSDEWMVGIKESCLQNERFNVAFHALEVGPDNTSGWTCITFESK